MSRKCYATVNSQGNVLETFEWYYLDDCPFMDNYHCYIIPDNIVDEDLDSICENCPCAYEVK